MCIVSCGWRCGVHGVIKNLNLQNLKLIIWRAGGRSYLMTRTKVLIEDRLYARTEQSKIIYFTDNVSTESQTLRQENKLLKRSTEKQTEAFSYFYELNYCKVWLLMFNVWAGLL